MAEEVKETMEQFETQLEESLNKAATNEDAVWNHLEELKESGEVLALTVGGVVNGGPCKNRRNCKWRCYRNGRRNPWIYSSIFIINKIC